MRRVLVFGLTVVALWPTRAFGQACNGGISFSQSSAQVQAEGDFQEGAKAANLLVGAGGARGFGGGLVGVQHLDLTDTNVTSVGGFAGEDVPIGSTARAYGCPIVVGFFSSGPNLPGLDISSISVRAGGQFGIVAFSAGSPRVIPTFGGFWNLERDRVSTGGLTASNNTYFGSANFGVGFVFDRIAITPRVVIPFALTGGQTMFQITAGFGF